MSAAHWKYKWKICSRLSEAGAKVLTNWTPHNIRLTLTGHRSWLLVHKSFATSIHDIKSQSLTDHLVPDQVHYSRHFALISLRGTKLLWVVQKLSSWPTVLSNLFLLYNTYLPAIGSILDIIVPKPHVARHAYRNHWATAPSHLL